MAPPWADRRHENCNFPLALRLARSHTLLLGFPCGGWSLRIKLASMGRRRAAQFITGDRNLVLRASLDEVKYALTERKFRHAHYKRHVTDNQGREGVPNTRRITPDIPPTRMAFTTAHARCRARLLSLNRLIGHGCGSTHTSGICCHEKRCMKRWRYVLYLGSMTYNVHSF